MVIIIIYGISRRTSTYFYLKDSYSGAYYISYITLILLNRFAYLRQIKKIAYTRGIEVIMRLSLKGSRYIKDKDPRKRGGAANMRKKVEQVCMCFG